MKKKIAMLLAAVLAAGVLFGCGSGSTSGSGAASGAKEDAGTTAVQAASDAEKTEPAEGTDASAQAGSAQAAAAETADPAAAVQEREEPLKVVTTIFPEYDWVRNILGDRAENAELTMLLDSGVDLHSYQPTAADILTLGSADLFIYVGGESDEWVEDALAQATNPNLVSLNMLEVLGDAVKEEEVVEGMQEEEHEHDHGEEGEEHDEAEEDHAGEEEHDEAEEEHAGEEEHRDEEDHGDEEHHEEEVEYDEHVWLSLRNASVLCGAIGDALCEIDPAGADVYRANMDAYQEQLAALDAQYEEAVSGAQVKTVLFGDRFPFRYLTDDYGLEYYAAFVGCSAETEASFETIRFLADKVDELSLHNVMTIEGADHRIAETIIENTASKDQQILTVDSMQSTTAKDVEDGAAYLSIMEQNLEAFKSALN